MAHRRAKLTVFGRQLLVDRIEVDGWTIARGRRGRGRQPPDRHEVGAPLPGARTRTGLEDRSSRPHRSPRSLPQETVEAILVDPPRAGRRAPPAGPGPRASRARRSATSCAAMASRAWPIATGPRASPSATSASDPASCSTWTSRSSGASPTAAATASAAGAHGTPRAHARLRLRPPGRRRHEPGRLRRRLPRRAGHDVCRVPARGGGLLRPARGPHRAGHDRQRQELHPLARLRRRPSTSSALAT